MRDLPRLRGFLAEDLPGPDGREIVVSQPTSGDVPESGLDLLNQEGDSVEVALTLQLVAA